ncbi:MAG TPA: hypothetical protein VKV26_08245 [Dehalococcoidia bacterium]|nr:hypothetical protein [Dehalococcoidia bacterium]
MAVSQSGRLRGRARAQSAAAARPARGRVHTWRELLLVALVAGCLVAVIAAAVVLAANIVMNDRYSAIVNQGAKSVDAAQSARADILDSAGASADALATTQPNARAQARQNAANSYAAFKEQLRLSWQNRSDQTYGEYAAFNAADAASTDYAAAIGAMNAAIDGNRLDDARAAFSSAYSVLNTRLLPALTNGLQQDKVDFMESRYASTSSTLRNWAIASGTVSVLLLIVALGGYVLTRSMHHLLTWELALAILLALGVGLWVVVQLRRGDTQAKVLVREAYDSVAGARDEQALVSQQNALESIAIFDAADPAKIQQHFAEIADLDLQAQQNLCGKLGCVNTPFTAGGGDAVQAAVVTNALDGQDRFGLPRAPLVANVHFGEQAKSLELARNAYLAFLKADGDLRAALQKNPADTASAATVNAGAGQTAFSNTINALSAAAQSARGAYDGIWHSVRDAARIGEGLAAAELVVALLIGIGLWRRRQELFVGNVH